MPVVASVAMLLNGKALGAVFININLALTVSGERPGSLPNRMAAAPPTMGAAILVPLKRMYTGGAKDPVVIYSDAWIAFPGNV